MGLLPIISPPSDASEMLEGPSALNDMAMQYPPELFRAFLDRAVAIRNIRIKQRKHRGTRQ